MMIEHEFIEWLKEQHADVASANVELGIGDDAAILDAGDQPLVIASDMIAEGTHFLLDHDSLDDDLLRLVGRKALAVNLSDLAAMASRPVACLLNLQLPKTFGVAQAKQIFSGVEQLAREFNVVILGGDTNRWDGGLVIGVTAIGYQTVEKGWRQNGAVVGDEVLVSGALGGSILGWHLRFQPRCQLALQLAEKYEIHGATDISDSLSSDLMQMIGQGQGIAIEMATIPISKSAKEMVNKDGVSAIEHALQDGEDVELIVTAAAEEALKIVNDDALEVPMTRIGRVIDQAGLWRRDSSGSLSPLEAKGYQH